MGDTALEVAERVARAADELARAAELVPSCNCEQLDSTRMATVIADLGRAEAAAAQVHAAFRALEKKHAGGPKGLATLETQSLEGCVPCEAVDRAAPASLSELAADAPAEATGGQCC